MKIHSSSINVTPIGFNRHYSGKNTHGQKNDGLEQQISPVQRLAPVKANVKSFGNDESANANLANHFTSRKALKALNAYIQELNQPLHDQSVNTLVGIDTYV